MVAAAVVATAAATVVTATSPAAAAAMGAAGVATAMSRAQQLVAGGLVHFGLVFFQLRRRQGRRHRVLRGGRRPWRLAAPHGQRCQHGQHDSKPNVRHSTSPLVTGTSCLDSASLRVST
jgi:hypothetical protein